MCCLDGIVKVKLQVQAGLTSAYLCSHCISSLFLVKVWGIMNTEGKVGRAPVRTAEQKYFIPLPGNCALFSLHFGALCVHQAR